MTLGEDDLPTPSWPAQAGHPRLSLMDVTKTWMAGPSPAMTFGAPARHSIRHLVFLTRSKQARATKGTKERNCCAAREARQNTFVIFVVLACFLRVKDF
jgi:hypothetical protein